MEKRSTTPSRSPMQAAKSLITLGDNRNPKKLDCCAAHYSGGAAMDGRYGGGFLRSRTAGDDYGETALLLPKNSENSGKRRMSLQPSPTPTRSSASSFPISPPSEMFCSHGATSDTYSPSLEPEGGRRRGKEPADRSLEIEVRQMSLQQEIPSPFRRSAETKTLRLNTGRHSIASEHTPVAMQKHVCHSSGEGSEEENSDVESEIEDHLQRAIRRSRGPVHFPAPESETTKIEARLEQWAEARTLQLVRKLKKKEDEIAEWENLKTMKARMQMREFEVKLEEKREKAMEKMQRTIMSAQRKAEKKKQKERASADKKAMEVVEAIEKGGGSLGKMPCKFICL